MPYNFTGKKCLVTGAGKGIGREIAIALFESGCQVFALSRTQADLDTLAEECPGIITIVADVADWEGTRAKLEQLGVMDGLVNNAGTADELVSCLDTSLESIKRLMDINLKSAINCTQVVAKKMIAEGKSGSIVNNSSVLGLVAYPLHLAYTLTKAGMDIATRQFALELGQHNIRVNSVNLTLVITPLFQKYLDMGSSSIATFEGVSPMGRLATLKEAVDPFLYLLSDNSTMVTGTNHVVDGGIMSSILV